jgi:hypothetical protein
MPKISAKNTLYNKMNANRNCELIHDKSNALCTFIQVIMRSVRRKWRRMKGGEE